MTTVRVRALAGRPALPLPSYRTAGAAGLDLTAAEAVVLEPGARRAVGTGLVLELPLGFEGQVRPRSGLALEHGVTVLNAPGTVDADYRGEVRVLLVNLGDKPYSVRVGDRVAQLVVAPVAQVELEWTTELGTTERGDGGFGHTGR